MHVAKRGMHCPTVEPGTHIRDMVDLYPPDDLLKGPGIVDYVFGAEPGPGVLVLGTNGNPSRQHYLILYKRGEGPLSAFYTPYHLCRFEVLNTIARAVLFNDAAKHRWTRRVRSTDEQAFSAARMQETLEGSLRRLGRDRIVIYQLHSPKIRDLEQCDWAEGVAKFKTQGKIRFIGISAGTAADAA